MSRSARLPGRRRPLPTCRPPRHPSESWDLMPSGAHRREQTGAASTQVEHPLRPCSCPPPRHRASSPRFASCCFPFSCSRPSRLSSLSPSPPSPPFPLLFSSALLPPFRFCCLVSPSLLFFLSSPPPLSSPPSPP